MVEEYGPRHVYLEAESAALLAGLCVTCSVHLRTANKPNFTME